MRRAFRAACARVIPLIGMAQGARTRALTARRPSSRRTRPPPPLRSLASLASLARASRLFVPATSLPPPRRVATRSFDFEKVTVSELDLKRMIWEQMAHHHPEVGEPPQEWLAQPTVASR
jgi:hypothetical protein